ncbi:hypothetical protein NKG94_20260 [Micromonospora sp. M12]
MTTETAPAGRITLPGGEMLAWSDLPQDRLADGGPLAALVARLVPPGAGSCWPVRTTRRCSTSSATPR